MTAVQHAQQQTGEMLHERSVQWRLPFHTAGAAPARHVQALISSAKPQFALLLRILLHAEVPRELLAAVYAGPLPQSDTLPPPPTFPPPLLPAR